MRWEEMTKAQVTWGEMRTVVISWEELRKGEKTSDEMRWDEVKKLRRHEMSWDEMGWRRLRWQRDAMSNFQEKLRRDEIRWNEERFNIRKACEAKRHLNLQKWSEPLVFWTFSLRNVLRATMACTFSTSQPPKVVRTLVFLTFWLGNVLRATMACTFSTSQLPKVVRTPSVFYILTWDDLEMCFGATTACTFSTSQPPKVVRTPSVLYILTWKRASRHNGVHLNCQKWSAPLVFCTFWLGNVLRATMACTFSTSQLVKVVRSRCVLYILAWKCASHQNGVQFFISHLASWLRTRRFSEPTFRPSGASNHWKNTVLRDFPTFSRICIFFLLTLSLLLFSLLIFLFSSLWPFPSLLFICPYCREFDF